MQKIRNRADLRQSLIDEFRAFLEVSSGARVYSSEMLVGEREVQLGHGKQLAGAIVQIAAEFTPLFVSQIQEMTGDNAQLLFGAP